LWRKRTSARRWLRHPAGGLAAGGAGAASTSLIHDSSETMVVKIDPFVAGDLGWSGEGAGRAEGEHGAEHGQYTGRAPTEGKIKGHAFLIANAYVVVTRRPPLDRAVPVP